MRSRFFLTGLTLLLASFAGGCSSLSFIPADAMATLANPSHVEAYRTGTIDDHPGYGGKMDGFAVFQTGDVTPDLTRTLAAIVADPSTYIDATRPDDFVPLAGYRFYRRLDEGGGQVSIDVLVSFDCDEILLVAHDKRQKENFRRLIESDPGRGKLLEITRNTFSSDVSIQALPEVRAPSTEEAQ